MISPAPTRPPRLVYVVNDAAFFAAHRLPFALRAREEGYEVHVAAPAGPALDRLRSEGFATHALPLRRRSLDPLREWGTLRALRDLYVRLRPDLVHHVTVKPVVYGGLAARSASVPACVATFAGTGYLFSAQSPRARLLRALVTPLLRRALAHPNSATIFENGDDRDAFVERGLVTEARAVLIRSVGVPLDEFTPSEPPEGTPVVTLAARMLWPKGVAPFVEAARILRGRGVDARFALAGPLDEENPEAVPADRLAAWAKEGVVEWWGRLPTPQDVHLRSSVLCLPSSYGEGVPRVLLEAAACSRPVVTTDAPGCREACIDGRTGFLVPVGDAVALADALQRLVEDAPLRRRMGEAGRRMVEDGFSQEEVVDRTLDVYRRLGAGA